MTPHDYQAADEEAELRERLEAFVRRREGDRPALPWVERLTSEECGRLRSDLTLVLSEPESTGEPLDWREIREILREWADRAGWEGPLIQPARPLPDGRYAVELPPRDARVLVGSSAAVQNAIYRLIAGFLPFYPTAGHLLPQGRLKKLKNRNVWQIELPDGYRLRYGVDHREYAVRILYLGPHPDRNTRGRERATRRRLLQGRPDRK